jgi:hypothetical protein
MFLLYSSVTIIRKDKQMARKPNYGYEKRQKELAKKAKKEEKSKRRQEEKDQEKLAEEQSLETPEEE